MYFDPYWKVLPLKKPQSVKFRILSYSVISGNLSKNGCVWAAQWPTSSELKIKFDPSLDRSWYEFFKIIKNHGPKNPPTGCNLDPKFHPQAGHVSERKMLT